MKKLFYILILFTLYNLLTPHTLYTQWNKQTVPVSLGNKTINGIKFTDSLNGWACTGNLSNPTAQDTGFILHTTNGGTNWFVQYYNTTIQLYTAIGWANNMVGYTAGYSFAIPNNTQILIKTTNSGINWFSIPIPYNQGISQFFFINPDTVWEVSGGGSGPDARITTDGGYTWQVRINGITSYPSTCIQFLNFDTGFCGSGIRIFKTTNAGLNWNINGTFSGGVSSIYFINQNTGFLGLEPDTITKITITSNGGITWQYQYLGRPHYNIDLINCMYFENQIGWAGIPDSYIYKTTNFGLNWGFQIDSGWTNHLSFIDSSKGWTGYLKIYHTSNGGGPIYYVGIIKNDNQIPCSFKLFQNYPNPFNPKTKIQFELSKTSFVKLNIFDLTGKEKVIWNSEKELSAGEHELNFDGSGYASGVYFYQLLVTDSQGKEVFSETKKMILLK